MSQSIEFIHSLKLLLKSNGITYMQVAQELSMSEAAIKRMFALQKISLDRIEKICAVMGISLLDLSHHVEQKQFKIDRLTKTQEKEFISDTRLILVTILIINNWQFEDILEQYTFDKFELIQILSKLDKLKILQLQPNNKIKLFLSRNFVWHTDGPIQNFFKQHVLNNYLHSNFEKPNEYFQYIPGMLTETSLKKFQDKFFQLLKDFNKLCEDDKKVSIESKNGIGLVFAMRPWDIATFSEYRKKS